MTTITFLPPLASINVLLLSHSPQATAASSPSVTYNLRVCVNCAGDDDAKWDVYRRYSEFHNLKETVEPLLNESDIRSLSPFPPKTMITPTMEELGKRCDLLEVWLQGLLLLVSDNVRVCCGRVVPDNAKWDACYDALLQFLDVGDRTVDGFNTGKKVITFVDPGRRVKETVNVGDGSGEGDVPTFNVKNVWVFIVVLVLTAALFVSVFGWEDRGEDDMLLLLFMSMLGGVGVAIAVL